ncbi:MAG: KxYKxGKxW signal peptide domain-containing protein [Streptococcus salivarius]
MEQKVRFKMHKEKKNWVTIGVTALSMVTVAGGTLLADQQVQADEQNPANQSSDSSQVLLQETPATTNDAATTVAPTISADDNTASVAILSQMRLARQPMLQIGQRHCFKRSDS